MKKSLLILFSLSLIILRVTAETVELNPKLPYIFTDDEVVIPVAGDAPKIEYKINLLTLKGWGKEASGTAAVKDGKVKLSPLAEGIHIISLGDGQSKKIKPVRFLAISPPEKISPQEIKKQLPRQGEKLLAGKPYTILAMGDSVTATGDFEHLLAMLLGRATGNKEIKVVTAAHPGRSVDATVREFNHEVLPAKPDLGLLMYGLNDQAAFTPLRAFLEQTEYIVKRLQEECNTDMILLEPTPHIDIAIDGKPEKLLATPEYYAFRTIGFAQSLRELGAKLKIPVADTFSAIWGDGGPNIQAAAKNMWPVYPPHYSKKMESMIETDGKGDTIHPNALGHLQLAKAVFSTISGQAINEPLLFSAVSKWTDNGVESEVTVKNISGKQRQGTLKVYPLLKGELEPKDSIQYDLASGAAATFKVTLPQAKKPEDLLKNPADIYLSQENIYIPVVDTCNGGNHVYAVTAPIEVDADFVSERLIVSGNSVPVKLRQGKETVIVSTGIPEGSEVGRIPLLKEIVVDGKKGWAVADLAYVRFGAALPGEAVIDGKLDEWQDNLWSVVGEDCQARWTNGNNDIRKDKSECFFSWAAKAGKEGIYFALKGTGDITKDSFDIYFDTRSPEQLGTAGPYYWCSGSFADKGKVKLRKGETSRQKVSPEGVWTQNGNDFQAEMFIPYALMDLQAWPESGDLGFSLVWVHKGPEKEVMRLMWAEDGHPWNTRWYGVIRRITDKNTPLPFRVRIK